VKLRIRLAAVALAVGGILFLLYPAIRPFSDETSLQGAAAFASASWLLAHMLAMAGFTFAALGLLGFYLALRDSGIERLAFWTLVVFWLGVGLTLPFYGGEAFGLHAIGQEALKQRSTELVALAAVVRSGPELVMFLIGLLLLAVGASMAAVTIWKSGHLAKWSGVPFAVAFALYIPQFFGTQPIRVTHGLLVTIGCAWIAAELWRESDMEGPVK
jgi:uncharacterized membrane protein YhaH (DUF805 family)